jgi:hypothetical protein
MPRSSSRTVHRIWLNQDPEPEITARCASTWGEDVRTWGLEDTQFLEGIDEHLELIARLYGAHSRDWYRAVSDVMRVAILHRSGGLYVDVACERTGGVDAALDGADAPIVLVRPWRPEHQDHPRPCNGFMYASEPGLGFWVSVAAEQLERLKIAANGGERKPMYVTGPGAIEAVCAFGDHPHTVIQPPFATFDTKGHPEGHSVMFHRGWRAYA